MVGDWGFDTFGVFDESGESVLVLDKSKGKEYLLSAIIKICNERFKTRNFYLGLCRTPCVGTGGNNKKIKTNRRKRKNKKRKTNRKNYKR